MVHDGRVRALATVTGISLLALILAGTLVHAHQAALSVPDWPLSYGTLILGRWPGNVFYEQLHRALAAASALLLTALLIVFRRRQPRRVVGALFGLYLAQVAIGGVIVLRLNPPLVAALHVVVAQLIACGVWLVAAGAFREADPPAAPRAGRPPRLAVATAWALALQIVLGALARHPPGKTVFVAALVGHLAVALALLFLVPITSVRLARRLRPFPAAKRASIALGVLFVLQIGVAIPLFIVAPEPLTEGPTPRFFPALHGAHVLLATLLLTASAYLATRRAPPAPGAAAGTAGTRT